MGPDLWQNMAALIYSTYRWDYDNKLALELQEQQRDGDPNGEGIVWHRSSPCLAASPRLLNSLDPTKYIQYSTVGSTSHVPGTRPLRVQDTGLVRVSMSMRGAG